MVKTLQQCKDECEADEFCFHITHWIRVLPDETTQQICDLRSIGCYCTQLTEQKGATTHLLIRNEPRMVPIEGNKVCDVEKPQYSFYFDYTSTIECYNLCVKKRCKAATITGSVQNPYCEVFAKCDRVIDADERSLTFTSNNPQIPFLPRRCHKKFDNEEQDGSDTKVTQDTDTKDIESNIGEESSAEKNTDSIEDGENSDEDNAVSNKDKENGNEGNTDLHKAGKNGDEGSTDTNKVDKNPTDNTDSINAGEITIESNTDSNQDRHNQGGENIDSYNVKENGDSNDDEEDSVEGNTDTRGVTKRKRKHDQTTSDERRGIQKTTRTVRRHGVSPASKPTAKPYHRRTDIMQAQTLITGRNFVLVGISIAND